MLRDLIVLLSRFLLQTPGKSPVLEVFFFFFFFFGVFDVFAPAANQIPLIEHRH